MWDTVLPHVGCSWEPLELRILKQELANLSCKCSTCVTLRDPLLHHQASQASQIEREESTQSDRDESTQSDRDEAIQVKQKSYLLDRYIYATSDELQDTDDQHLNMPDSCRKDVFCPNCYIIWDLLRKTTKVYKDAESEIRPESSDKYTEKAVNFSDSASSVAKKPVFDHSSNLSLCDFLSDCSSASSFNNRNKKNNREKVTFSDEYRQAETKKEPQVFTMQGNCFCLENFMDTIRPPLELVSE